MNYLLVNTANDELVIVLVKDGTIFACNERNVKKHNEVLLPKLDEVLNSAGITLNDIDEFGVVVGPGSFTGIRVGIATIKAFKDVFNKLSKNKKNLVLALCSVLALVLLLVSEFASDDKLDSSEKVNSYVSSENYIKEQEEKLKELLEAIDGAGEVEVMITLESCYENVYLKDKNLKTESGNGDFKEESDETYIMAKTSSNTQEGVIIKVYEPVVKGVAVVATGGESEKVKMAIIETVSAVFNIDSTNISVEKMKTERKE
jgi:stage III sporulation protein AG